MRPYLLASLPLLAAALPAQQPHLQATLARLDAASRSFHSAQADVHKDLFNDILKSTDTQQGSIYFLRTGAITQMGARLEGADARTLEYKGGTLRIYNPGIRCYNQVSAAGNQAKVESFLTLGFGGSGADLARAWNITDDGPDTIDGTKVEKLTLVAKDQGVRNTFTSVTLWLDLDRGVSLRQVFVAPSGDRQTATYTNIRLNRLTPSDLKPFEIPGKPCK